MARVGHFRFLQRLVFLLFLFFLGARCAWQDFMLAYLALYDSGSVLSPKLGIVVALIG